jgi:hypothetical protein
MKRIVWLMMPISLVIVLLGAPMSVEGAQPSISVEPSEGCVDDELWLTGNGFVPNTEIAITFDAMEIMHLWTTDQGRLDSEESKFNIPDSEAGLHTIYAFDALNMSEPLAQAWVEVKRNLILSPNEVVSGKFVDVTGKGFPTGLSISFEVSPSDKFGATITPKADPVITTCRRRIEAKISVNVQWTIEWPIPTGVSATCLPTCRLILDAFR